jgi:hypothetical protein
LFVSPPIILLRTFAFALSFPRPSPFPQILFHPSLFAEVTADLSKLTSAKFLAKPGIKTPIFARFSTVGGEKGSSDSARDPRGFAVKFYTEEGNWDMVGNNTPVFFM